MSVQTFRIIWPEAGQITESRIEALIKDAILEGKIKEQPPTAEDAAFELHRIGAITLKTDHAEFRKRGLEPYPELARMVAVKDASQKIGEFIDWLGENGMEICRRERPRGWSEDRMVPVTTSTETLLAQFFEIDLDRAEHEKLDILEMQRELNEAR
jgi:hypothetical protein